MTTTPPKTHAEVAKKLWKRLLDADVDACNPDCDDQTRGPVAILAAAIRDAEERGRIAQIALDLPASLESEDRGNRLEAMIDRMIENNVNQGVVTLGGENGITRVAAPVGSILDDAGNVRSGKWLFAQIDQRNTATVFMPDDAKGIRVDA